MKVLSLAPQPRSAFTENRSALASADKRRERLEAIMAAGFRCEGCGMLAWSKTRLNEFELRDGSTPDRPHVFCKGCAEKHDVRLAQRAGRAR